MVFLQSFGYLSCHNTSQSAAAAVTQHYCTTAVTHSNIRGGLSVLLLGEQHYSCYFRRFSFLRSATDQQQKNRIVAENLYVLKLPGVLHLPRLLTSADRFGIETEKVCQWSSSTNTSADLPDRINGGDPVYPAPSQDKGEGDTVSIFTQESKKCQSVAICNGAT